MKKIRIDIQIDEGQVSFGVLSSGKPSKLEILGAIDLIKSEIKSNVKSMTIVPDEKDYKGEYS